jgi:ribonuclease P protein component
MATTSLTRARDFVRVQSVGRRGRSDGVSVAVAEGPDPSAPSCLGLAVGRRVGGAVTRNRVKRRLRAAWRESSIPPGYEVVVRPAPAAASLDFQDLVNHVEQAVSRATTGAGATR